MSPLQERRLLAGLNRAQVARKLGVSRQLVYFWEKGQRGIPEKSRRVLARVYGCEPADLDLSPVVDR